MLRARGKVVEDEGEIGLPLHDLLFTDRESRHRECGKKFIMLGATVCVKMTRNEIIISSLTVQN